MRTEFFRKIRKQESTWKNYPRWEGTVKVDIKIRGVWTVSLRIWRTVVGGLLSKRE
jgi:hypothetical protein